MTRRTRPSASPSSSRWAIRPAAEVERKEVFSMAKKITIENDPVEGEEDDKNPPITVSIS